MLKFIIIFMFIPFQFFSQHWNISQLAVLPEKVTNNAVCEGFVGDTAFVYSFAGLDSTKLFSGIHLRSYRLNTLTNEWDILPFLPDTMGKIATSASRVKNIIYIIGGYHVLANTNEVSSNKVHRFDTQTNQFLSDGANTIVPIDDQVQCVYKDSLIYVVTGWSNSTNVPNVQIYNPVLNTWVSASPTPNNNTYKSFGASGIIVGDTLFYLGGASSGSGFGAQGVLRKGYIDPLNPSLITWSFTNPAIKAYRSACASINDEVFWLGGAEITYNYNGIAYNGSGGVPPSNKSRKYNTFWDVDISNNLPMDLRGVAKINDTALVLVGGMEQGQSVTKGVVKLTRVSNLIGLNAIADSNNNITLYPNPSTGIVTIELENTLHNKKLELKNNLGQTVWEENNIGEKVNIDLRNLEKGMYYLFVKSMSGVITKKISIE